MPSRVGVLVFVLSCALGVAAAPASAAPPANGAPPAIDDTTPVVGETLNAAGDTWDGTQTSVTYQWRRCDGSGATCADIQDAAGPAYAVGTGDVGSRLQVRATAANAD